MFGGELYYIYWLTFLLASFQLVDTILTSTTLHASISAIRLIIYHRMGATGNAGNAVIAVFAVIAVIAVIVLSVDLVDVVDVADIAAVSGIADIVCFM